MAGLAERDAAAAANRNYRATLLTKAAALNIPERSEDGQVLVRLEENEGGKPYGIYGRYEDNFDDEGNPL